MVGKMPDPECSCSNSPPPDRDDLESLLTYRQAGELLKVSERTVWELVDTGQLASVRFGRTVRIAPADLRAFIASARVQADDRN